MLLTKKIKKKLFTFEEREIISKGYYGEELKLKAIKNKMISNYEILIPYSNYITTELLEKFNDGYRLCIVGFEGLKPLKEVDLMVAEDRLKERLRSVVGGSISVCIYLNKKLKLQQIEYNYLYCDSNDIICCDYAKAMSFCYDENNPNILMSEKYID